MKILTGIFFTTLFTSFTIHTDFLSEQKKFERVRISLQDKGSVVAETLQKYGLDANNVNILIIAYKSEDVLEIHAKKKTAAVYQKIASYPICARSGSLGPKRKAGDGQVPEGFYHINRFNPNSSYYLSLGLNYPNKSDIAKSTSSNPGGDIFIHGSCVTIGCMPMTNDKIKEIYLYAVYAKNNGQEKIPVYVYPFRMTEENMKKYSAAFGNESVPDFWKNIKPGYDRFEKDRKELHITVGKNGDYRF